jgi:hypothetical protein
MEYAGLILCSWLTLSAIVSARREARREPECPACSHAGRAIVEDARSHAGWEVRTDRWLATYALRRHYHCQHCGHGWWQPA